MKAMKFGMRSVGSKNATNIFIFILEIFVIRGIREKSK